MARAAITLLRWADMECIFCRIANGEIAARVAREDERTLAFHDLDPKAPVHVLVIPRRHIASVNELRADDAALMGELFIAAREIAAEQGIAESGYRLVLNTGSNAGQTVQHVHLHILGGRALKWPPG